MSHLLQWERVGTWGKWNMDRQHCLRLDSLSVQTWPFWYCILFLFLPRWVMSVEIKKNRREDGDLSLVICTGLPLSPLHIVTQCAATFTVRVYQIRCYFTSVSWYITSRVCKEPPSGACYQSCMFSLHLPSLPLWLVDKFFGCTCFHGLIVSTDLQQYLC